MEKRLLTILCILLLSVGLCGCGSSDALTEDCFKLESTELESKNGNYQITIEFFDETPTVEYVLCENNKELANDIKDKSGAAKFQFDILDKKSGKYIYKLIVKDEDGAIYEKEVEVKVIRENEDKNKDTEQEQDSKEEETQEDIIYEEKPNNNADNNISTNTGNSNGSTNNGGSNSTGGNTGSTESGNSGGTSSGGESTTPPEPEYKNWGSYKKYDKDEIVLYQGKEYRCRQSHTSLPDWTPENVASLWEEV